MTLDAVPVRGGTVLFESSGTGGGGKRFTARGAIDAEGRYELSTFRQNDGAIAGRHRVVVFAAPGRMVDGPPVASGNEVASKYNAPETTDLEVEVAPGENQIPLELHSGAEP